MESERQNPACQVFSYITINLVPTDKCPGGNHRIVSLYWKGEQIFRDGRGVTSVKWFRL